MQYGWNNCPDEVREQVEHFVGGCRSILGEDLAGVYLHGSLAMGCFNPLLSDLDFVVLSEQRLTQEDVRQFGEMMLSLSNMPYPIEMSVLAHTEINPWQHPSPFEYHYSEAWRERQVNALNDEALRQPPTDDDLAAHLVIARERGVTLYGEAVRQALPEVPTEDYLDSLLGDFDESKARIVENPVYGVLNFCRVYWFLAKSAIASKDEAGEWAQTYLPEEYRPIVAKALRAYRGNGEANFAPDMLREFALYVDSEIRNLL